MEKKETPAPYCHGEHMQPIYRFSGIDGEIYRTWICNKVGCRNKTQLPLYINYEVK